MKKLFFLCLVLISVTQLFAYAYDCYVDGIYYNLDYYNKVATVTNERNYMSAYSYSGSVVIPSTFSYQEETYTVKFIGTYAFEGCGGLTSVTIPNSVIYIGPSAFSSCSKLSSINIPNSVTEIDRYAFSYCYGLTSITIPNSVTTIREGAFQLVNNVAYEGTATGAPWMAKCVNGYVEGSFVYLDNTKSVLCGCSSVTEGDIIIPNTVQTIGNNAFYWCEGLTSVTIPNSVTTIGDDAFSVCSGLTSITFVEGSKLQTIENNAFSYCFGLTSISIPNSVTAIGDGAFRSCSNLTSVTIPNSVTTIGGGAFRGCSSLPSITIPSSVTSLGEAFYGCDSLKSVTINSDAIVSKTYNESYNNGLNLIFGQQVEKYTIGDSVTAIGDNAFGQCEHLTDITIGKSVTKIGEYAFYYCSGLTSVTIPNSVTTIGEGAFYGCSGLTSITIPDFVETIGEDAFHSCSSATSLTIGQSVKSIAEDAFGACEELKNIIWKAKNCNAFWIYNKEIIESFIFGDSVEVIPANLCYGMSKLTTINIPNSVTTIGESAFGGCSGLTSITIPNSVTTIGRGAFYGCSLTSVTINSNAFISKSYSPEYNINSIFNQDVKKYILGDSIKSIGDYAFYCSSGFTSINIPHSIVTIGNSTFSRSSLKSINIPNSVTNIGNAAFSECFNLESVSLGNSVTTIGDSAFHFCHISSITIPRSIKTIGKDAFLWCNLTKTNYTGTLSDWCGIKFGNKEANPIYYSHNFFINDEEVENDLIIPENVSSIEAYAFEGCFTLTSVTIPNSIKFIGERAFEECSNLTNVFVNWTDASFLPIIGKDIFASISDYSGPSNATLHVPAGTKSIYETADQWKDFGFIIEEGTGLEHIKPNSPASLLRCTKTIENGQLLIKAKGETYTPSGQKVR